MTDRQFQLFPVYAIVTESAMIYESKSFLWLCIVLKWLLFYNSFAFFKYDVKCFREIFEASIYLSPGWCGDTSVAMPVPAVSGT